MNVATSSPFRLGTRPELDGFRGVAVILVVAYHASYFLLPQLAGRAVQGGFIGVDLFFVLSGFLITSILLREIDQTKAINRKSFYKRRALRLLPALYGLLAGQVLYTLVIGDGVGKEIEAVGLILLYVGNWSADFHVVVPFALAQTWSLAIEEQFYIFWPICLIGIVKLPARVAVTVLSAAIVAVAALRVGLFMAHVSPALLYSQTETRLDGLLVGGVAAYALGEGWSLSDWAHRLTIPALAFLAFVVSSAHATQGWLYVGGFTLVSGAAGVILVESLRGGLVSQVLKTPLLGAAGHCSYSLYLWHPLVFFAVSRQIPTRDWLARGLLGFGVLAAVTSLSYALLERPHRRRRQSLRPG